MSNVHVPHFDESVYMASPTDFCLVLSSETFALVLPLTIYHPHKLDHLVHWGGSLLALIDNTSI